MTEESRGKRRKQANPKRNRVDTEQVSALGSEEDDEVGLWSLEPQDCHESPDKTSLTPSEVAEEPGSPVHFTRPPGLSPGIRICWGQVESEAPAEEDDTHASTEVEREQEPLRMYCKNSDSQNHFEDLPHYEFVSQLRRDSVNSSAVYRQSSRHDELPPAIWSPGAQHCSPESADENRSQQACPFCQRMYWRGASLRDHVKYCQERERGHMVCPLCGYTANHRSQMEQHLALHNQIQDKNAISLDQSMETRKFKCLECGKAFKYKHHLKEHLRIHSGEKPYECSNCKKRFSHSGSYSSHLSSKKCLSGGGHVGGNMGSGHNGHSQSSYHNSLPTSPSAGGGRSSNDHSSLLALQNQEGIRSLGHLQTDSHQHTLLDFHQSFPGTSDQASLWDRLPDLPLRSSIVKGTSLLPYLHSGTKFDQMLQEMLHRDVKIERDKEEVEERRVIHNGRGFERKVSPDRRREVRSGEVQRGTFGMTCRWCLQPFPNMAVLLQHEHSLCKMNRDVVEATESFRRKDLSSPPLFFSRSALHSENTQPAEATNGFSENRSPLQNPRWQSVPQQLLEARPSPPPRPDALSSRMYLSSQDKGSPSHLSPRMSSPRGRKRVPSSGFNSPVCLEVTGGPPDASPPQKEPRSPWSAQNEPLDLSLPKQLSEPKGRNTTLNGISGREVQREVRTQQLSRPSPTSHLPLQQFPILSSSGAPVFPASVFNGFNIFSQSGVGLSLHEGLMQTPYSQAALSPRFLSPMAYMMEANAEAVLKKIYEERQSFMGEVLNRSALDYLSITDEGFEGEGGPGRKRLKKTEEGLYACDICDKTFQKSSSLLRHKYEHTGKRPHECKICNKAFKHKHHLIEHSRLHSGEKPYQCDKCGKRFSHSGSYSQHMNHRYAYCSKDQDPDQDQEEMPLTPGAGSSLVGSLGEDKSLSVDDPLMTHSFLSDSSLDGAPDALKESEEKEERVQKIHKGLLEVTEDLRSSPNGGSLTDGSNLRNKLSNCESGNHINKTENQMWGRDTPDQNGGLDKCEMNMELTELPTIII
ncbi:PREDICTED: zinc finger E-box-binding homeobox 2-like [Cyprinodon variegatus]|uniref:Zinc finger E-box-binding homeobox 2-like n=2 Tax=Cyprinodon variegatus TaxID=28743 RepID=A0A3Q2CPS5_CYPVA|nr:PREDICTED: zinc finger E-box-binding homeobox 2-like [Cyprinodon variegatus]